jgi:putative colanic acid biosynthesis acetyltransferase WcaF
MERSLASFTQVGYDKGRPFVVQAMWFAVMNLIFMKWWFPGRFRPKVLRTFGASVGTGVVIRHRVRVLWPWKLTIGDDSWIGEEVWLLNLEPISIGSDVCLSQDAFLCTGSHDRRSPSFGYDNGPIVIEDRAWVAARATVLRGVTVGRGAVVGAGVVVSADVPEGAVLTNRGLRRSDEQSASEPQRP